MRVAFIAGPFRGITPWDVEQNIRRAEALGFWVACQGVMPIIPHANTRFFDGTITDKFWLEGTTELLARCDAIVLTDNWAQSSGARAEREYAERHGLAVFESDDDGRIALIRWAQGR